MNDLNKPLLWSRIRFLLGNSKIATASPTTAQLAAMLMGAYCIRSENNTHFTLKELTKYLHLCARYGVWTKDIEVIQKSGVGGRYRWRLCLMTPALAHPETIAHHHQNLKSA